MTWKDIPLFDMLQQQNGKQFNFPRNYCRECKEVVSLFQHVAKTGHLAYGKGDRVRIFKIPEMPDTESDLQSANELLRQELHGEKSQIQSQGIEIEGLKQVVTRLTQALSDKPQN